MLSRRSVPFLFLTLSPLLLAQPAPSPTARYTKLPLAFERRGEQFLAQGKEYAVSLQDGGARISAGLSAVSMQFTGGRKAPARAGDELPGKVNYIQGSDPRQWQLGLPTFGRVSYAQIYPGIDVVYYGNRQQLEFDLVLRAGADPRQIRLRFDGAKDLRVDRDGLRLTTADGEIRLPLPAIYQDFMGERRAIGGHYTLLGKHEIGFQVERYDRTRPLIIDPTIVYSGLIGGGTSTSSGAAISVDAAGNAYIAGTTSASDFPTANAIFPQLHVPGDGFVTKIDPTGTTLLYSTYIGGSAPLDSLKGIAADANGDVWVLGLSSSPDFPLMNAYQSSSTGSAIVLFKLDPSGHLQYSTFFGSAGTGTMQPQGIALDPVGSVYISGYVSGATVPITGGALLGVQQGGIDTFAAKFDASGALVYSTYLGGSGDDVGRGIAVDSGGDAYVIGSTHSLSFAGAPGGGYQTVNRGFTTVFVAKLNPAGSVMLNFTFLGGSFYEVPAGIMVDATGNVYVDGYTGSTDFPTTAAALQRSFNGGNQDGFVAKLDSALSTLTYSTYLGGSRTEFVDGLAVDTAGNAYVAGYTESVNFPTVAPVQASLPNNLNTTSLLQTTNSGASWTPFDSNISDLGANILPDPAASGVIVALTYSGVSHSVNGGATWIQTYTPPNPNDEVNYAPGNISRSLADSNTLYFFLPDFVSGSPNISGVVSRSTDGGVTWSSPATVFPSTNTPSSFLVVPDPLTASTAYLSANVSTVYKTTDGGLTWNVLSTGLTSSMLRSFAASPDGSIYMDNGNVIYKSTNQAASWTSVSTGLAGSGAGLTVSLSNPSVLYRSNATTTLYKTTNGGTSWAPSGGSLPTAIGIIAVSPDNPLVIYAAAAAIPAIYISTDGGVTWSTSSTGLGLALATHIAFDPFNAGTQYITASASVIGAYLAKVDPTGHSLVYSTYLGGGVSTVAFSVATNAGGDAFVTGSGTLFPSTNNAWRGNPTTTDAFVVRITDTTPACTFTLNTLSQTVYSTAQALVFTVLAPSGCVWNASSDQAWATVTGGVSGVASGAIGVSVAANTTGAVRDATLTIAGQSVTLTQVPSSCTYSFSPASPSAMSSAGGQVQVNITTGAGCPWIVVNNYPFTLSVSNPSGTGSGSTTLTVGATTAETTRALMVPIGSANYVINQAGDPVLSVVSTHSGTFTQGQSGATYTVTVSNGATAGPTFSPVTVTENVPAGLTLVSMAGTGWDCSTLPSCTRSDGLASGASYAPITVTVNVGTAATSPQVNAVSVRGGGSYSASASDSTTIIGLPSLSTSVTHSGNFVQGQTGATYSVTVSNGASAGPTTTPVTVTENPPGGLSVLFMAGTGWNCILPSCTRNDPLAPGASYPAITVTVNVGVSAASPQINSVRVSGGGGLAATGNDSTTILLGSVGSPTNTLNYARFHGPSDPDEFAACSNFDGTPCNSAVLAPGTNWTVNYFSSATAAFGVLRGQSSVFLTGDNSLGGLQGIGTYPSLMSVGARSSFREGFTIGGGTGTGTVNLIFHVTGTSSNTAGQSGRPNFEYVPVIGGALDYAHQVAYTPVGGIATIPIPFTFGTPVEFDVDFYALAQINSWVAGAAASADFSHTASLNAITVADGQGNPVPSFTIASESGTAYSATGVSLPMPVLSVGSSHTGSFGQGQQSASYTVTVSNEQVAAATSGVITVTDTLPAGLTLVSMTGNGWTCTGNSCTSNAVVNPGASASPITVLVNVSTSALSQVFNMVSVSGGGAAVASNSDPTTILSFSACDVNQDGSTNVADVQKTINEALGVASAVNDLNHDGSVNVVDVQIVINAALGLGCSGA